MTRKIKLESIAGQLRDIADMIQEPENVFTLDSCNCRLETITKWLNSIKIIDLEKKEIKIND